jgi:hypothetical protein
MYNMYLNLLVGQNVEDTEALEIPKFSLLGGNNEVKNINLCELFGKQLIFPLLPR